MALRASGRSSHTVATWPSRSMLSTSRSGIRPAYDAGPPGQEAAAMTGSMPSRSHPRGLRRRIRPFFDRGMTLTAFTADVSSALGGPRWLAGRRAGAWDRFAAGSLPHGGRGGLALQRHRPLRPRRLCPRAAGRGPAAGTRISRPAGRLAEPFGRRARLGGDLQRRRRRRGEGAGGGRGSALGRALSWPTPRPRPGWATSLRPTTPSESSMTPSWPTSSTSWWPRRRSFAIRW